MSDPFKRLAEDRAVRNEAWEVFEEDWSQIRADLDARGVGGRIADKAGEEAREVFDTAIAVADENRSVVGGTVAALLLWLLRNPLIDLVRRLFGVEDDDEEQHT
jgi:hypothetical protein